MSTPRLLGTHVSARPGPTVLIVAGIHGNEPAGLVAARRVLTRLAEDALVTAGRVFAVAANQPALAAGRRFIDRDLNRAWTAEQVATVDRSLPDDDDTEQGEQRALLKLFRQLSREASAAHQRLVFLDLHSTSGPATPFTVINDTLDSRRLALASDVPLLLGLEEVVAGTLLDYVERGGHPCVLVEGGQHDDPGTAANLEAAVWQVLGALDMVPRSQVPEAPSSTNGADRAQPRPPRVVEVTYSHEIESAEEFRMRPGYRTFSPVLAGEHLADDHGVEVHAPSNGLLLLPLYQPWGNDGFFLGRSVNRGWLTVSAFARAAGLARLLPLLPGVTRDPEQRNVVRVDRRVARWFVIELFHLAGFRRLRSDNSSLSFRRR